MYLAETKEQFQTAAAKLGRDEQVGIPFILKEDWEKYLDENYKGNAYHRKVGDTIFYSSIEWPTSYPKERSR